MKLLSRKQSGIIYRAYKERRLNLTQSLVKHIYDRLTFNDIVGGAIDPCYDNLAVEEIYQLENVVGLILNDSYQEAQTIINEVFHVYFEN